MLNSIINRLVAGSEVRANITLAFVCTVFIAFVVCYTASIVQINELVRLAAIDRVIALIEGK